MVLPLIPVASALLFLGEVPRELAAIVPIHMGGFFYTVIFLLLRRRLLRLQAQEHETRVAEEQRVRLEVELQRRQELSRLVHDNVLSVLNAAIALRGAWPDALRVEAGVALDLLESTERTVDSECAGVDATELASRLDAAWRRTDPACSIELDVRAGQVPRPVADAIEDASCEALRNSLRHAGAQVTRRIKARVSGGSVDVRLSDDGCGFDPGAVPDSRLGVRDSILARIRGVGGEAGIVSGVGEGTRVTIRWPA